MEIIGVNSKSVVHRFFQQMVDSGYLEKKQGVYYPSDKLVSLPLFESVRAWQPTDEEADMCEYVSIEEYLVDQPEHTVLLTVKGDSMVDAGLQEQDVVIVDTTKEARIGDIVIAVVDNAYTVKYLEKDKKGQFYLKPGNTNYDDIYPEEDMHVFGVVTWSFRKYS